MSVSVMTWVFQHCEATGNDRLVLLAIADRCNDEGFDAYPSLRSIAYKARCSERTAMRAVESLEALGYLVVERAIGRVNRYTVRMQSGLPIAQTSDKLSPVTSCQGLHSDTGDRVARVTLVSGGPVTLVSHNTSCTSSTPPARASQSQSATGPVVIGAAKHRQGGPLAGSLPRDHISHGFCGPRFCVGEGTVLRYARRYGADLEAGRAAIDAWLRRLHDTLGPDDAVGDNLWLDDQFQAWLVQTGRVKAAPARGSARREEPTGRSVPDAAATQRMLDEMLAPGRVS